MSTSGQCIGCKHYLMGGECEAFPGKIPYKIISGRFVHTKPFAGDHGIMYEPIETEAEKSVLAPSALDNLPYLDFSQLSKSMSLDYGSIHVPRLGDSMPTEDDKLKEEDEDDEEQELEKASDSDIIQAMLSDEGKSIDALRQLIETTTDPKLKEIGQAIQEDETKHQAALEQWMQENGGGESGSEEGEEAPVEEEADDATTEKDDGPAEMGEIPEDDEGEDNLGKGDGGKGELINQIRAVLEAHDDETEKADEAPAEEEEEEEDGKITKSFRVPIIKGDQQIVYGVVSEPETVDLQGDRISKAEIRKACHKFMQTSQKITKEHEGPAKADIIESYIAPTDFKCNGQVVKAGSWVMACKIHDKDVWKAVKDGEITGFSIAGQGERTEF